MPPSVGRPALRWPALGFWRLALLSLAALVLSSHAAKLGQRDFKPLSSKAINTLVSSPDPVRNIDPHNPASHLSKILIPRPPDTENNTIVREYIVSTLKKLKWHIEEDSFNDTTPYGVKRFTNIIATRDPKAPRRVIFVGATDSAAPCAFMLDLAEALDPLLDERQERLENGEEDDEDVAETTLQLVFFDGEEAYKQWTATDSIYGARHLAHKWSTTYIAPNAKRRLLPASETELGTIEHLILLDLLGAPNPTILSSFVDTAWLFDSMVAAEKRLAQSGAFVYGKEGVETKEKFTSFFTPREGIYGFGGIEDDHIPFLRLGVSVLHVIANPFPRVWHKLQDDASALDIPTMRRWNLILRVFMAEYLNLQPSTSSRDVDDDAPRIQRSATELFSIDPGEA
ncbi:Glutaminyl-peptide cyclotransferase-like protein [Trametes pubescens]|uniref:Peptide hydrolase n=1 Tax=Trametes pubescens TaxID=154538 RepID=A0A1M2VWP6_TRAPU|nr:Glutaminyl-peptide cyclotransferase-like protein [Trametes pubescens]